MVTFRPTASGPLFAFLALTFLSQCIPGSHAQSSLPACASPCARTAIDTSGCSSADNTCICNSEPFFTAFSACINDNCSSDDIQLALTFNSIACAGEGTGLSTPPTASSTTGPGTSSTLTFPSSVLTTTTTSSLSSTTTSTSTNTRSTSTPSTTSESTQTVSSSPTNAAASLSGCAHAAAALMAGGIGALVAIAV